MQTEINRFNSKDEIRASIEAYKEDFPLSNNLSNKNIVADIWLEINDTPESIFSLAWLISQSKVALIIVHAERATINGFLTSKGVELIKTFYEAFEEYDYKRMPDVSSPHTIVWGMMHPGLVYME